jgi:hypothetical protein
VVSVGHDQSVLLARLQRTVLAMLALGLVVGVWNAMSSSYSTPSDPVVVEDAAASSDLGAEAGELLALAQDRYQAVTTTTVPVTSTSAPEPASELLAAAEPTTTTAAAPTTTTTAPPTTTTTAAPTTTTTAPPTTTTTAAPTTTTTAPPTTTTTAPSAPTVPPTSSGPLTEEQALALFGKYFNEADLATALRVAKCESNLDPAAWNPNGYGGLFQHAASAWDSRAEAAGWAGASIFDAEANTAVSAWLLYKDGWWHWSCY